MIVPWPVYVATHLLLRARGHADAGLVFGHAPRDGVHVLDGPRDAEHGRALELLKRFADVGIDLADAVLMAIAEARQALILTWDFRHFRASAPGRRRHWPLLIQDHEVPTP